MTKMTIPKKRSSSGPTKKQLVSAMAGSKFEDYKEISKDEKVVTYGGFKYRLKRSKDPNAKGIVGTTVKKTTSEETKKSIVTTSFAEKETKEDTTTSQALNIDALTEQFSKMGIDGKAIKSMGENILANMGPGFDVKDLAKEGGLQKMMGALTESKENIMNTAKESFWKQFHDKLDEFVRKLIRLFRKQTDCVKRLNELKAELDALRQSPVDLIRNVAIHEFYKFLSDHTTELENKNEEFLFEHVFSLPMMKAVDMAYNWEHLPDKTKSSIWSYFQQLFGLSTMWTRSNSEGVDNALANSGQLLEKAQEILSNPDAMAHVQNALSGSGIDLQGIMKTIQNNK